MDDIQAPMYLHAVPAYDQYLEEDSLGVSGDVWQRLVQRGAKFAPPRKSTDESSQRLFVSATLGGDLTSQNYSSKGRGRSPLKSFVMYAQRMFSENEMDAPDVVIPSSFLYQNGIYIMPDESMEIQLAPSGFIELNEVILGALDETSYELSSNEGRHIQTQLASDIVIVRQSDDLKIAYNKVNLCYRVLMCSPVLQGTISLSTRIIFSRADWLSSRNPPDANNSEADDYLVPDMFLDHAGTDSGLHFAIEDHMGSSSDEMEVEAQQTLDSDGKTDADSLVALEALPILLSTPVPTTIVHPKPDPHLDIDMAVLVSYYSLAELKLFSGSMISIRGSQGSGRLCRVYGCALEALHSDMLGVPRVCISPSLYFNLGLSSSDRVHLTPLGTVAENHPIPVATELTIARVAGRLTNDKQTLDECLVQLRAWLQEKDRLIYEGDLITVVVDEERARVRTLMASENDEQDLEDELRDFPVTALGRGLAYFKISTLKVPEDRRPMKWRKLIGSVVKVDPEVTRISQSGVVHSRVPPKQRSYLRAGHSPAPPLRSASSVYGELFSLMSTSLHPMSLTLGLNCTLLLHGPRGVGKRSLLYAAAEELGIHLLEVNAYDLIGDTDAKTEAFIQIHFEKAAATAPCVLILRHLDALGKRNGPGADTNEEPVTTRVLSTCLDMVRDSSKSLGHAIMVVGTTSDIDKLPPGMQALFRHQLLCESPSEAMRLHILSELTKEIPMMPDVSLPTLAMQTAALVAHDLVDLVGRAGYNALQRTLATVTSTGQTMKETDLVHAGVAVTSDDFTKAMDRARASHSDAIGAPKIPNVTWDDVGGLKHVKDNIYDTIQLPLEHPELFASGMKKRSGILLYGPPGTGKTLVAKAVATNFSLNFLSVKGPELLNMYIGESEANVRRVFQRARDARPCVVFFDELDSVAPKRGEKGDSGGVMDRIVSQLLAEIDGMGGGADVFVIGATNRPDLLDPALLRPGRFDKLLYLGVSEDHESQYNILKALTRKFRLHPDLDLRIIAELCPFHYTGADFYALCSDAMLKAIIRTIEKVDTKIAALNASGPHPDHPHPIVPPYYLEKMANSDDTFVQVEESDFRQALAELVPSVSPGELERYKEVRKKFEVDDKAKKKGKGKAVEYAPSSIDEVDYAGISDRRDRIGSASLSIDTGTREVDGGSGSSKGSGSGSRRGEHASEQKTVMSGHIHREFQGPFASARSSSSTAAPIDADHTDGTRDGINLSDTKDTGKGVDEQIPENTIPTSGEDTAAATDVTEENDKPTNGKEVASSSDGLDETPVASHNTINVPSTKGKGKAPAHKHGKKKGKGRR